MTTCIYIPPRCTSLDKKIKLRGIYILFLRLLRHVVLPYQKYHMNVLFFRACFVWNQTLQQVQPWIKIYVSPMSYQWKKLHVLLRVFFMFWTSGFQNIEKLGGTWRCHNLFLIGREYISTSCSTFKTFYVWTLLAVRKRNVLQPLVLGWKPFNCLLPPVNSSYYN